MRRVWRQQPDGSLVEVTGERREARGIIVGDIDGRPMVTDDGRVLTSRREVREHMARTGQVPVAESAGVMADFRERKRREYEAEGKRRKATVAQVARDYWA